MIKKDIRNIVEKLCKIENEEIMQIQTASKYMSLAELIGLTKTIDRLIRLESSLNESTWQSLLENKVDSELIEWDNLYRNKKVRVLTKKVELTNLNEDKNND